MCAVLLARRFRAVAVILTVLLAVAAAGACGAHEANAATPLSVRWVAPADGTTVSGTLSGSSCQIATHDFVDVTKVKFYLDGHGVETVTRPPYSCQIDASSLSSGTHILKAKVYDAAGNVLSAYAFVSVPWTGTPGVTVTLQGDSLTEGSWWRMPEDLGADFELLSVSAHIGRSAAKGVELLRRQPLGHVVVFALGTNDWWAPPAAYREHLIQVMHMIGPTRCLVVPTIWRGGPATALNHILYSLASRYGPHRMEIAPWAEAVAAGRVRLPDGTHPVTQPGWQLRGQIVDLAVRACA